MSKQLDVELADAAGLSDPAAAPDRGEAVAASDPTELEVAAGQHARDRERPAPRRRWGLLAGLLVVATLAIALVWTGLGDAGVYAIPVDELVSRREQMVGRRVRVDGELVPGTLLKRDQPCEYRFRVGKVGKSVGGAGKSIPVRYPVCVVPPTFRDVPQGGVELTVEGKLTEEGYLAATSILVKCSSKYDPATHQEKYESRPPAPQAETP